MRERTGSYQLSFDDAPTGESATEPDVIQGHEEGSTHTVKTGARVKVQSKQHSFFSWATATEDFDVAMQGRDAEPYREPSMRFCLAMQAFSVFYPRHNSTVRYDVGHPLFVFPPSKNNTQVVTVPKNAVAKGQK